MRNIHQDIKRYNNASLSTLKTHTQADRQACEVFFSNPLCLTVPPFSHVESEPMSLKNLKRRSEFFEQGKRFRG
jgi:hypothetical protein